jgi:hypothetical protein
MGEVMNRTQNKNIKPKNEIGKGTPKVMTNQRETATVQKSM